MIIVYSISDDIYKYLEHIKPEIKLNGEYNSKILEYNSLNTF